MKKFNKTFKEITFRNEWDRIVFQKSMREAKIVEKESTFAPKNRYLCCPETCYTLHDNGVLTYKKDNAQGTDSIFKYYK